MKKTYLLITILLIVSLVLVACGQETPENPDSPSDTEASQEPKADTNDNLGKRSNPVALGEWIELTDTYYESIESFDPIEGKFQLRISEVERGEGVFDQLIKENQFNEPAPEGNEWAIAHLEIEMLDGDQDAPYTVVPFISIMASTGNEVSQDDWATLDGNEYGHVDLFPGGSHSGRHTFYVPEGDESLLVYEIGFDKAIYFPISE